MRMLKCPSQSNVRFIVVYVEVGESKFVETTLVSQLNGNPTLIKDRLTQIKVVMLYMKPKLLIATTHDTM